MLLIHHPLKLPLKAVIMAKKEQQYAKWVGAFLISIRHRKPRCSARRAVEAINTFEQSHAARLSKASAEIISHLNRATPSCCRLHNIAREASQLFTAHSNKKNNTESNWLDTHGKSAPKAWDEVSSFPPDIWKVGIRWAMRTTVRRMMRQGTAPCSKG